MKRRYIGQVKWLISPLSLLFVGVCMLSSCSSTPPVTSGMGTESMQQGDLLTKHLKVDNAELHKKLKITDVKSRVTNDLLELNVGLTSTYDKSLKLQYHFNWFDADGFAIEPQKSAWKALELHGMQTAIVRGLAPSSQVKSFNVYVREVPKKAYEF